jgi:hypothetical protein
MRRILTHVAVGCLLIFPACSPAKIAELPRLGAIARGISVSGISSGAYMAGQFQMAHAKDVAGAAIIAGGPYGCAESAFAGLVVGPAATMLNASRAVSGCMLNAMILWGVPNAHVLADKARQRSEQGTIDPISDLVSDRIYVFSGTNDRTVVPGIVATAVEFYRALGVPQQQIKFVADLPAGHAFVTESAGGACEVSEKPYVVDCDYDQAGDLLQHILGPLAPPVAKLQGSYLVFDQTPFTRDLGDAGLAQHGVVYIPEPCQAGGCRVHVAFHGCAQSRESVGDAFITGSGLARWAEANRILVLFPQIAASKANNPQGCWDWWGYTGRDFLTRSAPQIIAIKRMIDRLAEPPLEKS